MSSPSDGGPDDTAHASFPRDVPGDEHNLRQFTVRQLSEDRWEATATYEITDVMAVLECRMVVHAETLHDLTLLATVQSVYVGMIRKAEEATSANTRKDLLT